MSPVLSAEPEANHILLYIDHPTTISIADAAQLAKQLVDAVLTVDPSGASLGPLAAFREAERLGVLLANCTAERDNYRNTVETLRGERDEARRLLGECYILSGADPDGDGWEHNWSLAVDEVRRMREDRDFYAERETAFIHALLDAGGVADGGQYRADCASAVTRIARERDEARAMAPRWCRFPTMLTLMVGNVRIGVVGQLADGRWQALPMGGVGVDCDTDAEAARAVCARLGLPYIEVPHAD